MNQTPSESFVRPVAIEALDHDVLQCLLADLSQRHHLDGVHTSWTLPVLGFRLPASVAKYPRFGADKDIAILPVICESVFGAQFTVQATFPTVGDATHVAIPHTSPVFRQFRDGHFFAVFVSRQQPVFAFEVGVVHEDITPPDWERLLTFKPIVNDQRANYFTALDKIKSYHPYLTRADRLSIGWAEVYGQRVADLQHNLDNTSPIALATLAKEELVEPFVRDFLRSFIETEFHLNWAIDWMKKTVGSDATTLIQLLKHASVCEVAGLDECGSILKETCETYTWSSDFTDCGHRIAWIDSLNQRISTTDIDWKGFPEWFREEDYWKRQLWDLPYELGRILTCHDIPVDPATMIDNLTRFPMAEDITESHQLADDFLADAVANKVWTIPHGAIIEQELGPFAYIELYEYGESVFCVFRTTAGESYTAAVNPEKRLCNFTFPLFSKQENQEGLEWGQMEWGKKKAVEVGVRLILSAFIRDFWVVEEREQVFGHRQVSRLPYHRSQDEDDKPRIIYLPRIRYTNRPDAKKASEGMEYPERRQHTVAAHLRRSPSASDHQLILAKRYGFDVPQGHTFVRSHERGTINGNRLS